jgi:hypothetical protein
MASIVAGDLVCFHAATQSDADAITVGGAIDLLRRPDFTQIAANDDIEVISSSASDTQNCTITARAADGSITTQTLALTGVTAKIFSGLGAAGVVERVLSVELASVAIGTITVRRSVAGATLRVIPIGERGFSMVFRKTASDPVSTVNYYAKIFWKNTNATNALLSALVSESADPAARITHGLAASVNDSGTTTNRQTAPGGVTFAGTAAAVPGTDLLSLGTIGTWLNMTLPAADPPIRSTYTSQLAGSTT